MRKATDIIGLPVIDTLSGQKLGIVKDFIMDRNFSVLGWVLETRSWISVPRFLAWDDVLSVGEDALTVKDVNALSAMPEDAETVRYADGERKLKGLSVYSADGRELGSVEDVYFSGNMERKITGCECSEGFLNDLLEGRRQVGIPEDTVVGEDAIIVTSAEPPEGNKDIGIG